MTMLENSYKENTTQIEGLNFVLSVTTDNRKATEISDKLSDLYIRNQDLFAMINDN